MCVFLISPVPIAEPLMSEFIDTPVFNNLAPRQLNTRFWYPSLLLSQIHSGLQPPPGSIRNPSLCAGTPKLRLPSRSSRRPSALLPSSPIWIPNSCSYSRWTPPPTAWEKFYPNTTESLLASILALSSPGSFPSAECNYDTGNRKLLTIKLALAERRHWLEGAKHPFSVITDHKNLE